MDFIHLPPEIFIFTGRRSLTLFRNVLGTCRREKNTQGSVVEKQRRVTGMTSSGPGNWGTRTPPQVLHTPPFCTLRCLAELVCLVWVSYLQIPSKLACILVCNMMYSQLLGSSEPEMVWNKPKEEKGKKTKGLL